MPCRPPCLCRQRAVALLLRSRRGGEAHGAAFDVAREPATHTAHTVTQRPEQYAILTRLYTQRLRCLSSPRDDIPPMSLRAMRSFARSLSYCCFFFFSYSSSFIFTFAFCRLLASVAGHAAYYHIHYAFISHRQPSLIHGPAMPAFVAAMPSCACLRRRLFDAFMRAFFPKDTRYHACLFSLTPRCPSPLPASTYRSPDEFFTPLYVATPESAIPFNWGSADAFHERMPATMSQRQFTARCRSMPASLPSYCYFFIRRHVLLS